MKTFTILPILALILPVSGCNWIGSHIHGGRAESESLIGHIGPKATHVRLSPDGRRVAYVDADKGNDGVTVVVDGSQGKSFGGVGFITFSPDGRHVAYLARSSGSIWGPHSYVVMIDDTAEGPYELLLAVSPVWSPDSKSVAYVAGNSSGEEFVILGGKPGKHYSEIDAHSLLFTPNGKSIAYSAVLDPSRYPERNHMAVVDGKEGKPYDSIGDHTLVFSPDGSRVAYAARIGKRWLAVVDGKEGNLYDGIWKLSFSPDGQHFSYEARIGDKWTSVADTKEQGPITGRLQYDDTPHGHDFFDDIPTIPGKEEKVFVSGIEQVKSAYRLPNWPYVFDPVSQRTARLLDHGGRKAITVDGNAQPDYDDAGLQTFSPDGHHLAYVAENGGKTVQGLVLNGAWRVVLDGMELGVYDGIGDGINITYLTAIDPENGQHGVMINTNEEGANATMDLNVLTFSPDSRHLAFVVHSQGEAFVVLDGKDGHHYEDIPGSLVVFDTPHSFHYVAMKNISKENGYDLFRVEEEIR